MSLFSRKPLYDNNTEGERSKGDPNLRIGIAAIVSVYIIYLGIDLMKAGVTKSTDGMAPWVAILFGLFFIAAGGVYAWLSIRSYLAARKEMQEEAEREQHDASESSQKERAFFENAAKTTDASDKEEPEK